MMKITKEQLLEYERIRQSGETNMFDVDYVSELAGLDKEQIIDIMEHYSEYSDMYLGSNQHQ